MRAVNDALCPLAGKGRRKTRIEQKNPKNVDPGNYFSYNTCVFIFHGHLQPKRRCRRYPAEPFLNPAARAYRQIWRIPMAKGQKKSNRETKKPKKDKAVATVQTSIVPTSGRLVPPKTSGRVSG
jgi:hypothetical protein